MKSCVSCSFVSAYQLYLAMMKAEHSKHKDKKETQELCDQFKRTLGNKEVVVHFVGVW